MIYDLLCRTTLVLMVYRETVKGGSIPTIEVLSQVLGCLRLPQDSSLKTRLIENLGVIADDTSKGSNLCSLIDGFGEYDPRAFSLLEVCYHIYTLLLSFIHLLHFFILIYFRKLLH